MNKTLSFRIMLPLLTVLCSNEKVRSEKIKHEFNEDFSVIIADFEKEINKDISKDSTGSFSAVIFKGDEIIWSKAFGKSNHQKNIVADTNTIYRVGSISKKVTAYLMMLLVQEGTIDLDDRIAKYLPEINQL